MYCIYESKGINQKGVGPCTMVQMSQHLIIHYFISSRVSEQARKKISAAEYASKATSTEQANE